MRAQDFLIRGVQVVAFTASEGFESSRVLTSVLGKHGQRFSGRVEVWPLPEEIPPEVPRVELGSKDSRWAFSAAPARTSVSWGERNDTGVGRDQLAEIVQECSTIIDCCFPDDSPVRVHRFGFLVTSVLEAEDAPRLLIEQFCQPKRHVEDSSASPLRHSQGFQLHNFKAYLSRLDSLPINSWVRCKSGLLGAGGPPGIIVEQDLNTSAAEPERRLDSAAMRSFFGQVGPETQQILGLYFPD